MSLERVTPTEDGSGLCHLSLPHAGLRQPSHGTKVTSGGNVRLHGRARGEDFTGPHL